MRASTKIPLKITANTGYVALRWPQCPIVCSLIDLVEGPITGTSANISGLPACSTPMQILEQMGDRLPLIIDAGETAGSMASTIVQWTMMSGV